MTIQCRSFSILSLLLLLFGGLVSTAGAAEVEVEKPSAGQKEQVFARVNGRVVTIQEFDALYAAIIKNRFYHGNAQEGQPEIVRKDVTEMLIDRVLMLEEAERRDVKPDMAKIEKEIAGYEARYASSPRWKQQREQLLPGLRAKLEQQSMYEQAEKILRDTTPPAPTEVRAYYDQHPELFTEPEKLRLSLILLKVDPSASTETWNQAVEEGKAIYQRLLKGADFAETARLHSSDKSSAQGGDLGYVHRGMMPDGVHDKIDKIKIGEVSEPITTLDGIALIRLDDRVMPKLREFSVVETRARELLMREREDQASKDVLARLRSSAKVEILAPTVGDKPMQ